MEWRLAELRGYEYYAAKGYRILVSLIDNSKYDFVAEKDGEFIRVNVKLASRRESLRANSWSISKASGTGKSKTGSEGGVDVYLVWLPHQKRFIELPGFIFNGLSSRTCTIPVTYL